MLSSEWAAVSCGITVQQKSMRHADIPTTMNVYGDVFTDEKAVASSKVANLALNGSRMDLRFATEFTKWRRLRPNDRASSTR
jgi:hypothetical protein